MTRLLFAVLALSLWLPKNSVAQSEIYGYTIHAAIGAYPYGNNGPAAQALLAFPFMVAVDSKGAVYVGDTSNHMVRKIVGGQITTVAGTGIPGFSGDRGPAAGAQLRTPAGIAVDAAGNLYIYDSGNYVIRRVDTNGIISTFAGIPGRPGSLGDGGPATGALLSLSVDGSIAIDSSGNVYFSDYFNSSVRKVDAGTNIISTYAGVTGKSGSGGDGGPATAANMKNPGGLVFDSSGNLYISDVTNSVVRMVSATNHTISTVAGHSGQLGNSGDGGPAGAGLFSYPCGLAMDAAGNLYIADNSNYEIRKVTPGPNRIISTVAGNGTFGYSGDGGAATAAQLSYPGGVAVDSSGTLYIADTSNSRIRLVRGGTISEFAGADHAQGDGGKASAALLYFPQGIAWDAKGNLYIADYENNKVRKVTPDGNISTIAGTGSFVPSGDGGQAIAAGVKQPAAVAVDSAGNVFVATINQVRMIDVNGIISSVVNAGGNGGFSGDGQAATTAQLNTPVGLALDSSDNLYIADTYNHRIRKVSAGIISTVAGSGPVYPKNGSFGGDGGLAVSANLSYPYGVALDKSGNLLIADTQNQRLRLVDAKSGKISTIAGSSTTPGFSGDLGPATAARLHTPISLSTDGAGNIYFSDAANHVIRVVDGFGIISTIAGNRTVGFSGDGGPAVAAALDFPWGITADANGNVWIVDSNNSRIRKLNPAGPVVGNGPLGVVNAASFVSGGLVPGGMATLFGSNLTSGTGINLASSVPLATELLNTSVTINQALRAPIFAVDNVNGQQQINFQVPWELAGESSAVLQVVNNGAASLPVTVPVLAAQPGVFAYTVGSDTFAVVLHANFQLADSAHPVSGGETVLVYCTNLGAVSPSIADGAAGTGNEITVATPTASIGGVAAPVSFHGTAPGFVGLYQLNVQVPMGLDAKNQPLIISVGDASSRTVLLPVK